MSQAPKEKREQDDAMNAEACASWLTDLQSSVSKDKEAFSQLSSSCSVLPPSVTTDSSSAPPSFSFFASAPPVIFPVLAASGSNSNQSLTLPVVPATNSNAELSEEFYNQFKPRSGNGSGSSCHQCKSRRSMSDLVTCSRKAQKAASSNHKAACKKKYCDRCLLKFYKERPPSNRDRHNPASDWLCPSCRHLCTCAVCRRKAETLASPEVPSSSPTSPSAASMGLSVSRSSSPALPPSPPLPMTLPINSAEFSAFQPSHDHSSSPRPVPASVVTATAASSLAPSSQYNPYYLPFPAPTIFPVPVVPSAHFSPPFHLPIPPPVPYPVSPLDFAQFASQPFPAGSFPPIPLPPYPLYSLNPPFPVAPVTARISLPHAQPQAQDNSNNNNNNVSASSSIVASPNNNIEGCRTSLAWTVLPPCAAVASLSSSSTSPPHPSSMEENETNEPEQTQGHAQDHPSGRVAPHSTSFSAPASSTSAVPASAAIPPSFPPTFFVPYGVFIPPAYGRVLSRLPISNLNPMNVNATALPPHRLQSAQTQQQQPHPLNQQIHHPESRIEHSSLSFTLTTSNSVWQQVQQRQLDAHRSAEPQLYQLPPTLHLPKSALSSSSSSYFTLIASNSVMQQVEQHQLEVQRHQEFDLSQQIQEQLRLHAQRRKLS